MDRRKFLRQSGTLIAGAALAPYALPEGGAQSSATAAAGRLVLPMNRKWRYSRRFVEGGHAKEFDDSGFDRVVIPHTNASRFHGTALMKRLMSLSRSTVAASSFRPKREGSGFSWILKA